MEAYNSFIFSDSCLELEVNFGLPNLPSTAQVFHYLEKSPTHHTHIKKTHIRH